MLPGGKALGGALGAKVNAWERHGPVDAGRSAQGQGHASAPAHYAHLLHLVGAEADVAEGSGPLHPLVGPGDPAPDAPHLPVGRSCCCRRGLGVGTVLVLVVEGAVEVRLHHRTGARPGAEGVALDGRRAGLRLQPGGGSGRDGSVIAIVATVIVAIAAAATDQIGRQPPLHVGQVGVGGGRRGGPGARGGGNGRVDDVQVGLVGSCRTVVRGTVAAAHDSIRF